MSVPSSPGIVGAVPTSPTLSESSFTPNSRVPQGDDRTFNAVPTSPALHESSSSSNFSASPGRGLVPSILFPETPPSVTASKSETEVPDNGASGTADPSSDHLVPSIKV